MANVYDKLSEFYLKNSDAKFLFSKKDFERHLRKCAWKKESEEILDLRLKLFSEIILSAIDIDADSIYDLLPEDYLKIFYDLADFENKILDEKLVFKYLKYVEELFLERETKGFNGKIEEIEFIRNFFYEEGKFNLPKNEIINGYTNLKRGVKLSKEEEFQILFLKKQWINKIWEYFMDEIFEADIKRASDMFVLGKYEEEIYDDNNMVNEEFRDYFLFDYHLIKTDESPAYFFYTREKDNLDEFSLQIIENYLNAKFTIFQVKKENEDSFLCSDLFHDREFLFPFTDYEFPEYKTTLFYAHAEAGSIVLPFYFATVKADEDKIKNIIKEIKNAYKLYAYQEKNPTFTKFFERHNIAVRKILAEVANTNKINIIPEASDIESIKTNANILEDYERPLNKIANMGKDINLSEYAIKLLRKYYHDFLVKSTFTRGANENDSTLFACLKNFLELNAESDKYIGVFNVDMGKANVTAEEIKSLLRSELYDPRYLTEEGFLNLIYHN